MSKSQRTDHLLQAIDETPTVEVDRAVPKLGKRLTALLEQYVLADEKCARVSQRCYTPEFKAALADPHLTEEEQVAVAQRREEEVGYTQEVWDGPDLIYVEILACADEILNLNSIVPAVLALKAKACLSERPVEHFRDEGCGRAAQFLTQLTALECADGAEPPGPHPAGT